MSTDRPRRRFADDDDRDEPAPRRDSGGIPAAVVLLGVLGLLAVLGLGAAVALFTARADRRELEAARVEAEVNARLAADVARVKAARAAAAPRVLDEAAVDEVARAFQADPVAAKERYASVRWQVRAMVRSVSEDRQAGLTAPALRAAFDARFEEGEVAHLRPGTTVVIEAVCDSCEVTDDGRMFGLRNARVAR